MSTTPSAETLQAMALRYEGVLLRLVAAADDEAELYAFLKGPECAEGATDMEMGRHYLYREIRRAAAYALREFHPEVRVE